MVPVTSSAPLPLDPDDMNDLLVRLRAGDDDAARDLRQHLYKRMQELVDRAATNSETDRGNLSSLQGELGVLWLAADTVVRRLRANSVEDAERHAVAELYRLVSDQFEEESSHIHAPSATRSLHKGDPDFVDGLKRAWVEIDDAYYGAKDPTDESGILKGPRAPKPYRPLVQGEDGEYYDPLPDSIGFKDLPEDLARTDEELHVIEALEHGCKGRREIAKYTGLTPSVVRGCLERIQTRISAHIDSLELTPRTFTHKRNG